VGLFEILFSIWPIWLIIVEVIIILGLYRFYIANLNAEKWEERAREDGWLVDILSPVVLETATLVSASVLEALEVKYRQSQGVLARVAGKNPANAQEFGLATAEEFLKAMNFKNPGILMVARAAGALSQLIPPEDGADAQNESSIFESESDLYSDEHLL